MPLCLLEDFKILKANGRIKRDIHVECSHESVLLYGRYCKLSREVSQTPWLVEGNKTTVHGSVEGHISDNLAPIFGSDHGVLHGSGREDIDVRMLGRGRPFVMEF